MLFHEYSFLFVFLPITLVVYYLLPRALRNPWIFLVNCTFYAMDGWTFLPLLLFTITLDYHLGSRIVSASSDGARKGWLLCSLASNLGVLAYFKYIHFITSNLSALGVPVEIVEAPLPPGISFYVFQSLSYTLDLYRRRVQPSRSLTDFGAFVTLYPHLIAGPIVRYDNVKDQLTGRTHSAEKFASGVETFAFGLAKKLLIADTLAALCDPIFASHDPGGFLGAWASILLYGGQIYFDFSGYSDMAIGLGRMIGFELPTNFDSPYKATSFSDFWRRWHITLSTWLRDYLYIALGGNRRGTARTYANLVITMTLGGLWHGASWNFVLWGVLHGAFLASERALGERNPLLRLPPWGRRVAIFAGVHVAWVFFRLETLDGAARWLAAMFLGAGGLGALRPEVLLAVAASLFLVWVPENTGRRGVSFAPTRVAAVLGCLVLSIVVGYGRDLSPFLYFRF